MRQMALAARVFLATAASAAALGQALLPTGAMAQAAGYDVPISLDQAKRAAGAAEAEARRRELNLVIAIAGPTGEIVYFEHMDGALYASDDLAKIKAHDSARYRWPTRHFTEMQKAGQSFPDVFVGEGGLPLTVGGRVVGAIGVSGGADDMVAQAGVDALK